MQPRPFLDAIPLPAIMVRRDARIEAANPRAQLILGQEIEGRHFITVLRHPRLLSAIERVLLRGEGSEAQCTISNGPIDSQYLVSVQPLDDRELGVLLCFQDVSDQEHGAAMRRDFVANVSHELRTPLTAIMGFIETLKGPAQNDPEGRARFLDIMEREAARMNRLVGDLLSLSRVEEEERVRPRERVAPAVLIQSTMHGLAKLAEDAGVTMAADLPPHEVEICGDADQLRQVLTNLIENAIKYAGRGAEVTVRLTGPAFSARLRGEAVRIEVQDSGAGIDPLHVPRLTERFYRVDSHRSREKGGTGLGLAIVKHIVSRHRGALTVESRLGVGSLFRVTLPAETGDAPEG